MVIRSAISALVIWSIGSSAFGQTPDACAGKLTALATADLRALAEDAATSFYPTTDQSGAPRVVGWRIEKIVPRGPRAATIALTLIIDHPDLPDEIGIYVVIEDGRVTKSGTRAFVPPRDWARDGRVAEPEDDLTFADRVRQAAIAQVLNDVPSATNLAARIDASTASFPEKNQMTLVHVSFETSAGPAVRDVFVDSGVDTLLTHDFLSVGPPALARVALNAHDPKAADWVRNQASHYVVRNRRGVRKPITSNPEFRETAYGAAARMRVWFPDPDRPREAWASQIVEVRLHNLYFEVGPPQD